MKRKNRKRRRSITIVVQHARIEDIFSIVNLSQQHGEGNVDIRSVDDLIAAVEEGRFHVFIDEATDEIVGFAAVYPYPAGQRQLNELGTNLLLPDYRGLGIADFSVIFRSLYAMQADPGSICVSELYYTSVKSKAVLERNGFRQVIPCRWRRAHAEAASSHPVIHMELGYGPVPVMASQLLVWVEGGGIERNGVTVRFRFSDGYWLTTESGRLLLRQLSWGDLTSIRDDDDEAKGAPKPSKDSPPHSPSQTSGGRNRSK